jgi:hypothetical protein
MKTTQPTVRRLLQTTLFAVLVASALVATGAPAEARTPRSDQVSPRPAPTEVSIGSATVQGVTWEGVTWQGVTWE